MIQDWIKRRSISGGKDDFMAKTIKQIADELGISKQAVCELLGNLLPSSSQNKKEGVKIGSFFICNIHFLDPVQTVQLIHLHQEGLQIPDQCLDTNY